MNIFAKFESLEFITKNEQILIDTIKKNPVAFTKLNIEEVCDECGVSKSTVVRFCKKMGYNGYNQFKLFLVASFSDRLVHSSFDVDYNFPFNEKFSSLETAASIRKIYEQSVYLSSNFLNLEELEKAANALNTAKKIIICADENVFTLTGIFKEKLEKINKIVIMPQNDLMKISNIEGCSEGDVLVYVDLSANEKRFKEIVKIARLNKVKMVLISTNKNKVLNNNFWANIYFPQNETVFYNIGDFSMFVSLMYLLDSLYSLLYKLDYVNNNSILYSNYLKLKNLG